LNAIEPGVLEQLNDTCSTATQGPLGEAASFQVIERPFKRGEPVKLGDYSLQRNPRYFFVGTIARSPTALMGYGYLMEHLVLRATELGLGTCWMGYFNREYFPELGSDGLTPAIAVVGVPADQRMGERVIRSFVKANKRRDWGTIFFDSAFDRPLTRSAAGKWAEPLELVRLAPSSGNTQPWRVVMGPGGVLHFHMCIVRPRYQRKGIHDVDTGIAMAHLELAAREAGMDGEWRVEDPKLSLPKVTEYRVSWFPG
jgi:nitroreductase